MIARGDLAGEVGCLRVAELQEEILWLCEAAHVPVSWATQVLETLARKGVPTRAEITNAAMAERAECVMLNIGPFILARRPQRSEPCTAGTICDGDALPSRVDLAQVVSDS